MNSAPDNVDKREPRRRILYAGVLLSLAAGSCVVLLDADCSKSHVQETVTVAPRVAATPASGTPVSNCSFATPTIDAETEAAGDALAHAIVALKARRRDEALHYMNLARTRLTHLLNRAAADPTTDSKPTRERLGNELRELDVAERAARHNDYGPSSAQLVSITNELDHFTQSVSPRQN